MGQCMKLFCRFQHKISSISIHMLITMSTNVSTILIKLEDADFSSSKHNLVLQVLHVLLSKQIKMLAAQLGCRRYVYLIEVPVRKWLPKEAQLRHFIEIKKSIRPLKWSNQIVWGCTYHLRHEGYAWWFNQVMILSSPTHYVSSK